MDNFVFGYSISLYECNFYNGYRFLNECENHIQYCSALNNVEINNSYKKSYTPYNESDMILDIYKEDNIEGIVKTGKKHLKKNDGRKANNHKKIDVKKIRMEIIRFEKMHYKKTHVKKNYLINKDYIYEKKTFNLSKKGLKKKNL